MDTNLYIILIFYKFQDRKGVWHFFLLENIPGVIRHGTNTKTDFGGSYVESIDRKISGEEYHSETGVLMILCKWDFVHVEVIFV